MTYAVEIFAQRPKLVLSLFSFIFAALMVVNCGGSSSSEPAIQTVVVEREVAGETVIQTVVVEKEVQVSGETVVQTVVVEREVEVLREVEVERVVEVEKEVQVEGEFDLRYLQEH